MLQISVCSVAHIKSRLLPQPPCIRVVNLELELAAAYVRLRTDDGLDKRQA